MSEKHIFKSRLVFEYLIYMVYRRIGRLCCNVRGSLQARIVFVVYIHVFLNVIICICLDNDPFVLLEYTTYGTVITGDNVHGTWSQGHLR